MRVFTISIFGDPDAIFTSVAGLHLATGYKRIVIGKRGPYVEFEDDNIIKQSYNIPHKETWRLDSSLAFYNEYRSNCGGYVKLYHQKRLVDYADYKIGMYYISPSDLYVNERCCVEDIIEIAGEILLNEFF